MLGRSKIAAKALLHLEHHSGLPKIQGTNLEIRHRVYPVQSNRDFHTTPRALEFAILCRDF